MISKKKITIILSYMLFTINVLAAQDQASIPTAAAENEPVSAASSELQEEIKEPADTAEQALINESSYGMLDFEKGQSNLSQSLTIIDLKALQNKLKEDLERLDYIDRNDASDIRKILKDSLDEVTIMLQKLQNGMDYGRIGRLLNKERRKALYKTLITSIILASIGIPTLMACLNNNQQFTSPSIENFRANKEKGSSYLQQKRAVAKETIDRWYEEAASRAKGLFSGK